GPRPGVAARGHRGRARRRGPGHGGRPVIRQVHRHAAGRRWRHGRTGARPGGRPGPHPRRAARAPRTGPAGGRRPGHPVRGRPRSPDPATVVPERFGGLVTSMGGPTSLTAILARQLGVPCLVAAGPELHSVAAGTTGLVDGAAGTITAEPDPDVADTAVAEAHAAARSIAAWQGPGWTAYGVPVELLANVGAGAAARKAAYGVGGGIGLLRTELSFLASASEPAVAEQVEVYGEVLHAFDDAKVVVRTLDAGSDKPLAFAALTEEGNPALGV